MTPYAAYSPLKLARLELQLLALEPIPLEGFVGPALRGMLGRALHDASCNADHTPAFGRPCLYHDVFEAARAETGAQAGTPPFVLLPPGGPMKKLNTGETLRFGLVIFGQAADHVPALVWALFRWGMNAGLSRELRHFLLQEVVAQTPGGALTVFRASGGAVPQAWDAGWSWNGEELLEAARPAIPARSSQLELSLCTPLDLREAGHAVMNLQFQHILRSLLRNVSTHAREHGGGPLELDFAGLKAASGEVKKVEDATDWHEVMHYSHRQEKEIRVSCRLGTLKFEGELGPYLPLLELGQQVGVGKGRTMGFGGMKWRVTG